MRAGSLITQLFLCVCVCFTLSVQAEEKPLLLYEQKIKAGLVYNLLKYTQWPKTSEKLQICLMGGDSFEGYLSPLEGRTAQQFLISIVNIDQINQSQNCNLLVIHRNLEKDLSGLLDHPQIHNILTVSDIQGFATQGGMIELAKENEKINLYINNNAVIQDGLKIDERMLRLAKIVSGKDGT